MPKRQNLSITLIATAALTYLLLAAPVHASPAEVQRVSVAVDGTPANNSSNYPSISANGRYVAFESYADNLVPGDTNNAADIFVYDRQTQAIERISVTETGVEANGNSNFPTMSADGRFIAYQSDATNLVPGDDNGFPDIFLHDRATGAMWRISMGYDGSEAQGYSYFPSLSADGRYIAYLSAAHNLVSSDNNQVADVFVYDGATGVTRRVNIASDGTEANGVTNSPSISGDGRYIAFQSDASSLIPGDTNGLFDVFVFDQQLNTLELISGAYDGTPSNSASTTPGLSADGRYVIFQSDANNLVPGDTNSVGDVFVRDRSTGITERVSVATDGTQSNNISYLGYNDALSADGRFVIFQSIADNLVPGDDNNVVDIFMYDRLEGSIERLSESISGMQADGSSAQPSISADGWHIAYQSRATNLLESGAQIRDIYAATRRIVTPERQFPVDGHVVSAHTDWPQFTFNGLDGITWYGAWIGTPDGSQTFLYEWFEAAQICDANNTCTIPTDVWLSDGTYSWWMTYWGPEQTDYNSYWNETTIVVDFPEPTAGFTLTAPANGAAIETGPAAITWLRDPNVLWYNLWIGSADYNQTLVSTWVDATTACDATTCSLDVSGLNIGPGSYEVWVELWGPGGYVTWQGVNAGQPAATFMVGAPGMSTLTEPALAP